MDRLMARLAEMAARRARMRRIHAAAALREALPDDVVVSEEGETVVVAGKRAGMRWLRDPAFAILRDGSLRAQAEPVEAWGSTLRQAQGERRRIV